MGYQAPGRIDLLDGDALRRDLTALAHAQSDQTKLRKEALVLIRGAFQRAREMVKERVESGAMAGVPAARALSDLQDLIIQVIYDFAA